MSEKEGDQKAGQEEIKDAAYFFNRPAPKSTKKKGPAEEQK